MKKLISFTTILLLIITSCTSSFENHELRVLYPNRAGIYKANWIYPGIIQDSLTFATTDAYSLISNSSWAHILGPSSQDYKYVPGNIYVVKNFISFDANNTGQMRVCYIAINSYNWTLHGVYYQPGWHDVRTREKIVTQYFPDDSSIPLKMAFSQTVSNSQTTDTLSFNLHGQAILSVAEDGASDWVKITDANVGENYLAPSGYHKVNLEFTPNTSAQERKATFHLVGNAITTDITLIQKGVE